MDLDTAIVEVVRRAPSALSATQLARGVRLETGRTVKKSALESALNEVVASGRVREIRGLTKGKKPAPSYTVLTDEDLAAALLEPRLGTGTKPVKVAGLRSKLPAFLSGHFDAALRILLNRGTAYELPYKPGFLLARKPLPSDVVEGAKAKALRTLLAQASQLRATPLTLEDFLAWLDGENPVSPSVADAGVAVELTSDLLKGWYDADAIGSASRMIPIPKTWQRYQRWAAARGLMADIQQLRRIMDFLYKEGQIWLEPCDRPQELAESEQALLIPLSLGPPGYFWGWSG